MCFGGGSMAMITGQRQLTAEEELIKAAADDAEADLRGRADRQPHLLAR